MNKEPIEIEFGIYQGWKSILITKNNYKFLKSCGVRYISNNTNHQMKIGDVLTHITSNEIDQLKQEVQKYNDQLFNDKFNILIK